jgi:FkbM family methyltransferase
MPNPPRKLAFVLAATEQGTLIVNRFDRHEVAPDRTDGVGHQLLDRAAFDPAEVDLALDLLELRRATAGDGVVAVDCGANLGVHAISWARRMTGWGEVIAIEAQERIFYALAGNIALNNCFNARALHAAVGDCAGTLRIPTPDHLAPASFGSLELRPRPGGEFIGQAVAYTQDRLVPVPALRLDDLRLARLDLLKIDVEGMEPEVLAGAAATIRTTRPLILVEHFKTGRETLAATLHALGYAVADRGLDFLAVHADDPCADQLRTHTALQWLPPA